MSGSESALHRSRRGDVASAQIAHRVNAFAEDDSGSAYFQTDYHHHHLASALLGKLTAGHSLILLSGDPPADCELIERSLNEAGKDRYRVSLLHCRPGMEFGDLARALNRGLGLGQETRSEGLWGLVSHLMHESSRGLRRVLVLDNAEVLDPPCFDELLHFAQLDAPYAVPLVLLVRHGFGERIATSELEFLQSMITAEVKVDRLELDEVGAFIRYQLNALGEEHHMSFPAETVQAIAGFSGGSAAMVNRLAREVLAGAATAGEQDALVAAEIEAERDDSGASADDSPARRVPSSVKSHLNALSAVGRRRGLRRASVLSLGFLIAALSGVAFLQLMVSRTPHEPGTSPTPRAVWLAISSAVQVSQEKQPGSRSANTKARAIDAATASAAAIEPAAGPRSSDLGATMPEREGAVLLEPASRRERRPLESHSPTAQQMVSALPVASSAAESGAKPGRAAPVEKPSVRSSKGPNAATGDERPVTLSQSASEAPNSSSTHAAEVGASTSASAKLMTGGTAAALSTPSDVAPPPAQERSAIRPIMDGDHDAVARAQTALKALGLYNGTTHGTLGPQTRRALSLYQRKVGLAATGHLDEPTALALANRGLIRDLHKSQCSHCDVSRLDR